MTDQDRLVIVGAGPAGLAAALALADAGIGCTLVDDNAVPGGQGFRAAAAMTLPGFDPRADAMRDRLAAAGSLVRRRAGMEVVSVDRDRRLWIAGQDGSADSLRPEALILCPGTVEVTPPVPGWTLPGVFGLGGLQILAKSAGLVPAGPVVLAGAGPLLRLVAAQLLALGAPLAAVIDAAPRPDVVSMIDMASQPAMLARGLGYEAAILRAGVPLLRGHGVVAVLGEGRVAAVEAAPLDADWRPTGRARRRFEAAVLGLGFGLRPNVEMTGLAGAEHDFAAVLGGWHPRRNAELETTLPGIFAAGDGAGVRGVEAALAEGAIAAYAAATRLAHPKAARLYPAASRARERLARLERFRRGLARWSAPRPGAFSIASADTVVCRCEDVTRREIEAGLRDGFTDMRALKMRTRAGMGLCQGRVCAPAVQHLVAAASGRPVESVPLPTARAPLRPVAAGVLASLPDTLPGDAMTG